MLRVIGGDEADDVEVLDGFYRRWSFAQVCSAAGLERRRSFEFASISEIFGRALADVDASGGHAGSPVEARVTGTCRQGCPAVVSSEAWRTDASESVVNVLTGGAGWTRVARTVVNHREAVLAGVSWRTDTDVTPVRVGHARRTKETRERRARINLALWSTDAGRTDANVTVVILSASSTILASGRQTWSPPCHG